MAFELFSIVTLYFLSYPDWSSEVQQYIFFLSVLIPYLLPFVYGAHMSEKWLKIKAFFYGRDMRVYPPIGMTISNVRPRKAGM